MSEIEIQWDERGLVPVVVQDRDTQAVLMLAWMNREALDATLQSGIVHFYSRSRKALWKKGESSGNILSLISLRTDCDSDAIILSAVPAGPTCHTGKRSCFYKEIQTTPPLTLLAEDEGPNGAAAAIIETLYKVMCQRRDSASPEKSYTRSLLDKGYPKIEEKIREESGELLEVLAAGDASKVVHETADLLFHVLVGLCARGIEPASLWNELGRRFGVGGHVEKAARTAKQ